MVQVEVYSTISFPSWGGNQWMKEEISPKVLSSLESTFAGRIQGSFQESFVEKGRGRSHENTLSVPDLGLPEGVTEKRKLEFYSGRIAAAYALARAGAKEIWVNYQPDRSPLWPSSFVGSISHSGDFVWAAVAEKKWRLGVGVDSEQILTSTIAHEIIHEVLSEKEMSRLASWLDQLHPSSQSDHPWNQDTLLTLIFSAKESLYKCLAPTVGFFDFHDAEMKEVCFEQKQFKVQLTRSLGQIFKNGFQLTGRFECSAGYIHTGIVMSA